MGRMSSMYFCVGVGAIDQWKGSCLMGSMSSIYFCVGVGP